MADVKSMVELLALGPEAAGKIVEAYIIKHYSELEQLRNLIKLDRDPSVHLPDFMLDKNAALRQVANRMCTMLLFGIKLRNAVGKESRRAYAAMELHRDDYIRRNQESLRTCRSLEEKRAIAKASPEVQPFVRTAESWDGIIEDVKTYCKVLEVEWDNINYARVDLMKQQELVPLILRNDAAGAPSPGDPNDIAGRVHLSETYLKNQAEARKVLEEFDKNGTVPVF